MSSFRLEWSEFETNIRQSFKELRDNQNHFDVTLATDDDHQFQAHKIILSAGSDFFNKILTRTKHSNPFIYLKGIKKVQLEQVLDFLYNGETNIAEEELKTFLEAAQEMEVKGLQNYVDGIDIPDQVEQSLSAPEEVIYKANYNIKEESVDISFSEDSSLAQSQEDTLVNTETDTDLDIQIQTMMVRNEGQWKCKVCMKTFRDRCTLKRHAETHIESVSHTCHICNKISSTRRALRDHIANIHSGQLFDCDVCGKTGMTRNGFYKHSKKHMFSDPPKFGDECL